MKSDLKPNEYYIERLCFFFTFCFFIASIVAGFYLNNMDKLFDDFIRILLHPSPLVTDYYNLGSLNAAFFNAGMCGLGVCLLMLLPNSHATVNSLAGYFLVVAHCFYGLNFLTMWPPILGIFVFCKVFRVSFRDNLDMAMFSTAFGPFVSEFIFRYHIAKFYVFEEVHVSVLGFIYMVIFCLFLGFAIPAMLPGALKLHRGYNLYNGGLAFGLLGLFIYAFMYKTMGVETYTNYKRVNKIYYAHDYSYHEFVVIFFLIVFVTLLLYGWYLNGKSFKGYGSLMKCTGHNANFFNRYGAALSFINIGVYGLMILTYFVLVVTFTDGAGFTGATTGVILAGITFSAKGQHPKNVWPVLLGYVVLSVFVTLISTIAGYPVPWTLSTQGYMNGAAFATGLCPIAGRYGWKIGVAAGVMCAIMCTSTSAMHGGLVLYNGGLTSGITALILIPCLDYYFRGTLKQDE